MLTDLDVFFAEKMTPPNGRHGESQLEQVRYAAAALMMVCAKADFHDHPEEERAIHQLLEETFNIEHQMILDLLEYVDEETGTRRLQEFTSLVNQHYTDEDKQVLIEHLWRVAWADGRLDRFEEQYVARVAFMIDVSAEAVAGARQRASVRQG